MSPSRATALSDAAVARLRHVARWPEFSTDRYTIVEAIGQGGMATVYAAFDTNLEREVAIKVSNAVESAALERRLAAESRVLAQLEHPGIVPVHDVGRLADGRLFYVMKRVRGETLTAHLQRDSDLGERLRIFERICEAVAFAHARRILHRDLKPDNVMIGAFGEVMVMDWGVAKALEESPEDRGTVLGTHGFMAPEQAQGDSGQVDERSDIYSLGALLAHILDGLGSVPRPLRSISARALEANREARYPTVEALIADIARFRAREPVLAHRETLFERASRVATVYRMPILLVLSYIVMRAVVAWTTGW
jgi:serine/threonine protein kinase